MGALCLSWWQYDSSGFRQARWSEPNEDKHKAPASTPPCPLSLQDEGDANVPISTAFGRHNPIRRDDAHSPIRSSKFIEALGRKRPIIVFIR